MSSGKGKASQCKCEKPIHRDLDKFTSGHGKELTTRLHTFLKDEPEVVPIKYESRTFLTFMFRGAEWFQEHQGAPGWEFSDIHMAMWILLRNHPDVVALVRNHPLATRFATEGEDRTKSVEHVKKAMLSVEPCLKHLFRSVAALPIRGLAAPKIPGDVERAVVKRDEEACILMGTADPEAVSILPFGVDIKDMKQADQDAIDHFLLNGCNRPSTGDWHKQIMSGLKSGDCSWSMISLSPQMRDWWNKLYFVLEFFDVRRARDPSADNKYEVKLRFRWCPVREPNHSVESVRKGRTKLRELSLTRYMNGDHEKRKGIAPIAAVIPSSWQPLASGQIFYVSVASETDGWKMGRLLEMRRDLTDLAHMSNAAYVMPEMLEAYRAEDDAEIESESDTMSDYSVIDTPSLSETDSDSESMGLLAVD